MLRYTLRRILIMIPTLLVISFITFVIIQLPPGDFLSNQIAEPEITLGSRLPMSAMNGLSAMRSGYFTSSWNCGMPFERAVTT